ncbi:MULTISPECIES: amino acid racemase [unclassified Beijerinckia]|uniref:aspartate/glutamate racemase family protein n=1 Tax=unclassified Beijerinckia TaxID=2638183 RepID=UPI00089CFF06|nr:MULTISPECIES: amino acid racemase [unclassified Beijerinckia]MDH7795859.1 aspartate racemase [Beijerinckia sp. GAS462]SEC19512.1 aspartate racemase [Beijerinckia sp. 28-YEA-48]
MSDHIRKQRRRIGLIGGMSWRSTMLYYERLNTAMEGALGAHHSFEGAVWNLNYAELLSHAAAGDMDSVEGILVDAAKGLEASGCDVIVLTAVTAHHWHETVQQAVKADVPHVLASVAQELDRRAIGNVGVLGTGLTCDSDFLPAWLARSSLNGAPRRLSLLDGGDQREIDALIQDVLTAGRPPAEGRTVLEKAVMKLRGQGAEAVVLACTELPLLLPLPNAPLPLLDSVQLHVDALRNLLLSEKHVQTH